MIILQKPIITEKAMKMAGLGAYTFLVNKDSNKLTIAKAVTEQFKVDVLTVKIINVKGELKMQRRARKNYMTKGFKKAIVQIKKGQIIPLFEAPKESASAEATTDQESEPKVIREKRNILRGTKVRIEKGAIGASPSTQRKVITGK